MFTGTGAQEDLEAQIVLCHLTIKRLRSDREYAENGLNSAALRMLRHKVFERLHPDQRQVGLQRDIEGLDALEAAQPLKQRMHPACQASR